MRVILFLSALFLTLPVFAENKTAALKLQGELQQALEGAVLPDNRYGSNRLSWGDPEGCRLIHEEKGEPRYELQGSRYRRAVTAYKITPARRYYRVTNLEKYAAGWAERSFWEDSRRHDADYTPLGFLGIPAGVIMAGVTGALTQKFFPTRLTLYATLSMFGAFVPVVSAVALAHYYTKRDQGRLRQEHYNNALNAARRSPVQGPFETEYREEVQELDVENGKIKLR